jgi:transposase
VMGITWPIPPEIGDAELERLLFTPAGFHEGSTKSLPDWAKVHEELKRRGVTLMILWEETEYSRQKVGTHSVQGQMPSIHLPAALGPG